LTHYLWHPGLAVPDLIGRLSRIYDDPARDEAFKVARSVALLATERVGPEGVRYLEGIEGANPRRPFDLNLYPAGRTIGDVSSHLARIVAHFAIPAGSSESLFEVLQSRAVGHLAGGVHRAGEDFFTVYHGVEEGRGAIGADS